MPVQAFTGDLVVLRRMARVRKGTVVAMFIEGERPLLRQPGELLLPDRNPLKHRISVMPISTEPVRLRVRVIDLRTLDGQHLEEIELGITVRLAADQPERILELAAKRGPHVGEFLNEQVREGVENTARAGVKMTTHAELVRHGVASVLRERWLPRSFVGLLAVLDFEVLDEQWAGPTVVHRPHVSPPLPAAGTRATGVPPTGLPAAGFPATGFPAAGERGIVAGAPGDAPVRTGSAPGSGSDAPSVAPEDVRLTNDPRLASIWRRRVPTAPRGLVGARAGDEACVVAVVDSEPPAFESRQLWEDFAGLYDDRHLRLLLCSGRTQADIVRSWFAALGLPARLDAQLQIEASRDRMVVRLPAELADDLGPRWAGLDGPPVAALRRLFPARSLTIGYDEPDRAAQ